MSEKLKVTLVKSTIGRKPKHILIVKQLRLSKLNSTAVHDNTPAIRGLINCVNYLLAVEECV